MVDILPVPGRLDPPQNTRTLMVSVAAAFYVLYNSNPAFRRLLASVANLDSVTGNRMFDRHQAVLLIKDAANKSNDRVIITASDGAIYKCLVTLLKRNGLGLRDRRIEYARLTHQRPATVTPLTLRVTETPPAADQPEGDDA